MYKIAIAAVALILALITNAFANGIQFLEGRSKPLIKPQYTSNVAAKVTAEKAFEQAAIGYPYLGVMVGAGFAKIGKSQLDTTAEEGYGYTKYLSNNNYYGSSIYGINGGYEFWVGSNGLLSIGVGLYESSNYNSTGQVWHVNELYGDNIHKFDYEYKLQSTRLMLETQFAWQFDLNRTKLIPFILLGVGSSLNFANSYEETVVGDAEPVAGFSSHRNTNLAYQLGAGIAIPFNNDQDRFFVVYRYVDLGEAQFNIKPGDPFLYQLNVGRIRANEFCIGYARLFDF